MEWILKKVVSRAVSAALRGWLDEVSEEQLQTGLASGELKLTDVAISKDALVSLITI